MELFNHGNSFSQLVHHITDQDLDSNFDTIKDNLPFLQNDDLLISTLSSNQGKVYSFDGSSLTSSTIEEDEYVIILESNFNSEIFKNTSNGWIRSQNKNKRGTPPKFNLYDRNGDSIDRYSENNFEGDYVFRYKENDNNVVDPELGISPSYFDTSEELEFEWTLNNVRYSKNIDFNKQEEIRGYYYWKNTDRDDYYNGWSPIIGDQRVPIIQTKFAEENDLVFDLGTTNYRRSTNYIVELRDSGFVWSIKDDFGFHEIGTSNPVVVWQKGIQYDIDNLISDSTDSSRKIEFVDPADTEVGTYTTNGLYSSFSITIPDTYSFNSIRYRDPDDTSVFGEIFLTENNQNNIVVKRNQHVLIEETDYTINGSQVTVFESSIEKDDNISVTYTTTDDVENAVYDVAPCHFYNSKNSSLNTASFSEFQIHFENQLVTMPGFLGDINDQNNYYNIHRNHRYGGTIRQQIRNTSRFHYALDNDNTNPFILITKIADDYTRFMNYFKNKVAQLWTTKTYSKVSSIVDEALSEINIGKTKDFRYAFSDMAYFKNGVEKVYSIDDDTTTDFKLPRTVNFYGHTRNHVYVWLKEKMVQKEFLLIM